MKTTALTTAVLLLATATAKPLSGSHPEKREVDPSAIAILESIVPTSKSCSGGEFSDECATAEDAAQPLLASFHKYGLVTQGEQAALISYMAYESGGFKYVRNHFPAPGRPGQGTRCMMMPEFVSEFAATLQPAISTSDPAALLDDVIKAGADWEAASWYYSTKCTEEIKDGVKSGTKDGWSKFITDCINTTIDEDREAYWTSAAKALNLSGN